MCIMSAITQEVSLQWPQLNQITNLDLLKKMKEVLQAVEELDRKFSTKDCVEPGKEEYIGKLEARIVELESQLSKIKEVVAPAPATC